MFQQASMPAIPDPNNVRHQWDNLPDSRKVVYLYEWNALLEQAVQSLSAKVEALEKQLSQGDGKVAGASA